MSEWKWCEDCDHHYSDHKHVGDGRWRCMKCDPEGLESHYFDVSDLL